MLAFVVLYITKATNVGQRLSELEIELQHSDNMPTNATYTSTLPVNASESNITLQASNHRDSSTDSKNNTTLKVCISQWLQDALTVRETLHCIGDHVKSTKG